MGIKQAATGPNYRVNSYLLLMEKGRLSPGGGRPSPPLLMAEVEKFLVDMRARLATWANISESEISPNCKYKA